MFKAKFFYLTILLPALILSIYGIFNPSWYFLLIPLFFFLYDSLGIQIGYHKLLSHRSFKTHIIIERILVFLGIFAGQNSPINWMLIHQQLHHPYADTEKDPHTPNKGLFYSYIGWYWKEPIKLSINRKILKDYYLKFLHRYYIHIIYLYGLILYLIDFNLLISVLAIPMILSNILVGTINVVCHTKNKFLSKLFGCYRNFDVNDNSQNSIFLGILSFGLGLHNNHHKFPKNINSKINKYEIDLSYSIIKLIQTK